MGGIVLVNFSAKTRSASTNKSHKLYKLFIVLELKIKNFKIKHTPQLNEVFFIHFPTPQ